MYTSVRNARSKTANTTGSIHPRAVDGRYNRLRWALVWLTQAIFYSSCWIPWQTEAVSRQAILFDIPHEKFYLFGLVLWPQDALLFALLLIAAATTLFLVTALAGRLFCGFVCPQTVYTSLFTWIEAQVEGDHLARRKLEQAQITPRKLRLKLTKHVLWLAVAAWSGLTLVGYFTPIRQLLLSLIDGGLGPWETFWFGFYALFMYVQAGFAREAVCQHMCPYSRFQGVMIDEHTRSIGYDVARGEPRAHRGRSKQSGDCVDCGICVQVCPTGIDIRDGLQYACINCGLCADACDNVMRHTGKATGLIRFAPLTQLNPQELKQPSSTETSSFPHVTAAGHSPSFQSETRQPPPSPVRTGIRARPVAYMHVLAVLGITILWTLFHRSDIHLNVLRDRYALAREADDGHIENSYVLKIANLAEHSRDFHIGVTGIPGIRLTPTQPIRVDRGSIESVQVTVSAPAQSAAGVQPLVFSVRAEALNNPEINTPSTFVVP